ncbi:MAG: T9SS C-terminal target domain-containing protein [Calditrichaeota bacterium]|nr:MAG: T9SS C-terminal target domain-containing protein [Calditrichota bacterium]
MKHFILFFALYAYAAAQVVYTDPPQATANDTFDVIFDATQGDGGLKDYSGSDVYAHTGVTIEGEGPWQYVIANWSTNLSKAKLTKIGTNLWKLHIGDPYNYYGVSRDKKITQLCFVFRNGNGSRTGRDTGGADIFLDLFEPGLTMTFNTPQSDDSFGDPRRSPVFISEGQTYQIETAAVIKGTQLDKQVLYINNIPVDSTDQDTLRYSFTPAAGMAYLMSVGTDTAGARDTTYAALMVNSPVENVNRPQGTLDGITYTGATGARLSLLAPGKQFVYVIGDFNDWRVDAAYAMQKDSVDEQHVHWWLDIDNLSPGTEYAFQYLVDGTLRIADPFTDKILDPWNDSYIPESVYPNLKTYPEGKTEQAVAVLQTAQTAYTWHDDNYVPPDKHELIVYELLVRDFVSDHGFATIADSLDYLQNLGINAIELMPINEFEGNESWGYNPSFYFAPDKYYGPKKVLKALIDSCHARGMAVIQDMVLNHSFGQSPLVRLYADGTYGPPSPDNPWYNPDMNPNQDGYQGPHPFGVGYDFNHESILTQEFVDRVLDYWITEYHIDGFRFDLSKGFTQKNTGDDVSAWSAFDGSRINILKRMADALWAKHPDAYVILEHFADNSEETILADYGMLLWGNLNYNYNEATMGWNNNSDFSWGYFKERGWSQAGLVTYMESHDEERLMYKNLQYGNSSGDYSVKDLSTALDRVKLAAAFFLTLPGPKMIWQFGELGYDFSIEYNGRTGNKPIRWDYLQDNDRKRLYKTFAALLKLRRENPAFHSPGASVSQALSGAMKRIIIRNYDLNATIIGNFGVSSGQIDPAFPSTGVWYDYFSGDSLTVNDVNALQTLDAGAFHIYTNKKLPAPEAGLVTALASRPVTPLSFKLDQNYPNPFNPATTIYYTIGEQSRVVLTLYDVNGRRMATLVNRHQNAGRYKVIWFADNLASGVYFYTLQAGPFTATRKMILLR